MVATRRIVGSYVEAYVLGEGKVTLYDAELLLTAVKAS